MKNIIGILAVAAAMVMTISVQAQVGLKVSGNYSIVYGPAEEDGSGNKIDDAGFGSGFAAGIFYRAGSSGLVGFQGELLYEQRNSKSMKIYEPAGLNLEVSNKYTFINLPLLALINIGNFKPYVGVNIGYLINAKGKFSGTQPISTDPPTIYTFDKEEVNWLGKNEGAFADYSDDPNFNRLEVGANVGLILQLSRALHLDLRFSHTITDFTNDKYEKYVLKQEIREDNDRHLNVSLGLGLAF